MTTRIRITPCLCSPARRAFYASLVVISVAVAVALLTACGATTSGDPAGSAGPDRTATTPATDPTAGPVPVAGTTTVAYFFAVGCVDCLPAAKAVAEAAATAPAGVAFVAVNMLPGDTEQSLKGFLADAGAQGMRLVVDGGQPVTAHRVAALSTTIVFDATGKETFRGVDATAAAISKAVSAAQGASG